jgi:hypothetical protein
LIETDPVGPSGAAGSILVAQMHAPQGWLVLGYVAAGVLHRFELPPLAALLPPAIETDVQPDGIVKRRYRMRATASDHNEQRCQRSLGPHAATTDISAAGEQVSEFRPKSL